MSIAITADEVAQLLAETPFAKVYGFRLHALDDGQCTLLIPYQAQFDRPDGLISGPIYMTAADVGVWIAIMTRLGKLSGAPTVTVEMNTAFLRGGKGQDVLCHSKILKWGRRLIYGSAECVDARGALLTHHTLTYIRPDAQG